MPEENAEITCDLTVDKWTLHEQIVVNQGSIGQSLLKSREKSILITPAKRAERDATKSRRRRLQKVYFRLPKSKKKWWKFEPLDHRSKFVARWKIFMLIPLCIEVWIFPYRLALGVPSISSEMQIILAEFAVDFFCLMDMVIILCTALPANNALEEPVTTFIGIARRYFQKKFLLEIVPSYPYWVGLFFATNQVQNFCQSESIVGKISWACVMNNRAVQITAYWILSALRVAPRFYRLICDFQTLENNLEMTVRALQILKFAMMIFLTAHWVGCFFYFIAVVYDLGPNTWVFEMEYLLPLFHRFGSPTAVSYLLCLYKGLNALSSLEYVIHYPNNLAEQLFCIFVMIVSIWLQGKILGTLLNYMVDKDPVAEAHKKEMEELRQFIESKNLPPELSGRLLSHFEFQYQKAVENRASSSVRLPRSLMIKVSECKYREVLDKCAARGEIFFGCEPQFLSALLMKLKVVFYMPNEEVFKKDDLSRELCFVLNGACHLIEDDKVKRVVRHDVPNMAPVLGELAFFFGIVQPFNVRARPDGDVQLLVLSREEGDDLFNSYPDELTRVGGNILRTFGLDRKGQEVSQGMDDDNADALVLRNSIKNAIVKQQYETFMKMTSAAKSGDVDILRDLLRCGAELDAVDYDGRSAFAMACYEGSYKVVELLLEECVDKNTKNRWNKTPLNEAVSNRQGPVVELLLQWKAGTDPDQAPEELRQAASRGELEELKRLIVSRVDPNSGDYDHRTALHMASSMKHIAVVEFLIECKAEVNVEDRWGCTPLQDAVAAGDEQLALLIKAQGGSMSSSYGVKLLCDAAARGDVKTLNLLVKCAGLEPDLGDFDNKRPLHFAAEEARLLAVSYLISNAADPDIEDRWGNKPLDLALKGGTLNHLYCAKLIHGWGGGMGSFGDTEVGQRRMQDMQQVRMDEVRKRVKCLVSKKFDLRTANRNFDDDCKQTFEASLHLVETLFQPERMKPETKFVRETNLNVDQMLNFINAFLVPCLAAVPLKRGGKSSVKKQFSQLFQSLCSERTDDSSDTEDAFCAIDSEEEDRLFEELDHLIDVQERAEAFRGNSFKFMANSFQRTFLKIQELEAAFRMVCEAFRDDDQLIGEPVIRSSEMLVYGLKFLSMPDPTLYEVEDMIEGGMICVQTNNEYSKNDVDSSVRLPIQCLIAGSERFRQMILKLKTDPTYCALLKTNLVDWVPNHFVKQLSQDAKEIEVSRIGKVIFMSESGDSSWFVLLAGKLRAVLCNHEEKNIQTCDICEGDVFGGYNGTEENDHIRIEVVEPSKYVEFNWSVLESLSAKGESWVPRFSMILGENSWRYLSDKSRTVSKRDMIGSFRSQSSFKATSKNGSFRRLESSSNPTTFRKAESFGKSASDKSDNSGGEPYSEAELNDIKLAFVTIHSLWQDVSMGSEVVASTVVRAIHDNLGEIGSELFCRIFLETSTKNMDARPLSKKDFWFAWMKFLSNEAFSSDSFSTNAPSEYGKNEYGDDRILNIDEPAYRAEKSVSCSDAILARYSPSRRLQNLFFEEHILDRYETSFLMITGDLKKPIPDTRIPEFLEVLFPSFPHNFSSYNVREALELFGRHGAKSKDLYWSDMRKILRERKVAAGFRSALFIRHALNPKSWLMECWEMAMKVLAVYYFISVPIRICFLPWHTMIHEEVLGIDLSADCLCVLNVVVLANTAYINSRAMWVTNRSKILRRIHVGVFLAACPLDWFAYLCGASNELSCWLRLSKFFLMYTANLSNHETAAVGSEKTSSRRLANLSYVVFGVIHISACIWFYCGRMYQYWFPDKAISWLFVSDSMESKSFTHHDHKFGLEEDASVFEQYVVSFYWVSATITSNGLVGDLIPNNELEIVFTMILMIFNLTLFRYVTGEVSSAVMKDDEKVVKARAGLEALESFLKDKRIGNDLRESIRQHYKLSQSNNFVDQTALFSRMSHSLRTDVASYSAREYLDDVALFQGCGEKLLDSISVLLREVQFSPEEYLYRAGEVAQEMYFVVSGSVDEIAESKKGGLEKIERSVHRGRGTGDLAFFFGIRHLVSARGNRLAGAVCLRLPRAEFLALLKHFPDDEEKIAQAAMISLDEKSQKSRSVKSGSQHQSENSGSKKSGRSGRSKRSESDPSGKGDENDDSGDSVHGGTETYSEDGTRAGLDAVSQRIEALRVRRQNDRTKLILTAAAKGELETMKQALKNDKVNISDALKRTPLHVAASEGQLEIVKFLISSNAEVNAEDVFRNTSLNDAVRHKHDAVAQLLRDHGGKLVLEKNTGGVLLCQASFANNLEEVKRLITNGISSSAADGNGRTALHIASSEGLHDLVGYLLECEADVNCRDKNGGSALDDAVRHGHVSIQKLLRSRGCSLNVTDCAVKMCEYGASGNVDAIKVLVENGVDCSIRNHDLRTAAHLAACNGMISVLDFLIAQGDRFDVNAVDKMGGTPSEDAQRHGKRIVAMLLLDRGGLLASDPRIPSIQEAQSAKLQAERKERRRPGARRLALDAQEMNGWRLINDNYVPGIQKSGQDIQTMSKKVMGDLGGALPIVRSILSKNGIEISSGLPETEDIRSMSKKPPIKVLDDVIALFTALASSVTATSEAINSDFPRKGALRIVVKDFWVEIRSLRRKLKVCMDMVKLIKKVLQELRAIAQPRNGVESTRARRNSMVRSISFDQPVGDRPNRLGGNVFNDSDWSTGGDSPIDRSRGGQSGESGGRNFPMSEYPSLTDSDIHVRVEASEVKVAEKGSDKLSQKDSDSGKYTASDGDSATKGSADNTVPSSVIPTAQHEERPGWSSSLVNPHRGVDFDQTAMVAHGVDLAMIDFQPHSGGRDSPPPPPPAGLVYGTHGVI